MIDTIFYLAAFFAVISALNLVLNPNPVFGALGLVGGFFMIGVIYVLMRFEFFGVMQVLIYAGAILVLFLFIIMLLDMKKDMRPINLGLPLLVGFIVIFSLCVKIISLIVVRPPVEVQPVDEIEKLGTIKTFAQTLFNEYLLLVEFSGFLLIIAIVGAVVISKKNYFPQDINS